MFLFKVNRNKFMNILHFLSSGKVLLITHYTGLYVIKALISLPYAQRPTWLGPPPHLRTFSVISIWYTTHFARWTAPYLMIRLVSLKYAGKDTSDIKVFVLT